MPEPPRNFQGIDPQIRPESRFISPLVKLSMMGPTKGNRVFVAHLASERLMLGKAQMMRIDRSSVTNQAGLRSHKLEMLFVTIPARRANRKYTFVDWPSYCRTCSGSNRRVYANRFGMFGISQTVFGAFLRRRFA